MSSPPTPRVNSYVIILQSSLLSQVPSISHLDIRDISGTSLVLSLNTTTKTVYKFIGTYSSRGLGSLMESTAARCRQRGWSIELSAHTLNCKHEVEKVSRKRHGVFELSKPLSGDVLSSTKSQLLSLLKQRHQLEIKC